MTHRFIRLLPLITLIWFSEPATAQWRAPQLFHIGPEEGLPAEVYCMTQDETGYMYFGTNTGMYRYDGHAVEFFGHDPEDSTSIGSGDVYELISGSDGWVWMTLRYGGLNSFDPATSTIRRHPLPPLPFEGISGAHGIYEEPGGLIWVGGAHFRLYAYDRSSGAYSIYTPDWIDAASHRGRFTVLSIVEEPSDPNVLWLSVLDYTHPGSKVDGYGLVSFDKVTKKFAPYPCGGHIRTVDPDGIFWGNFFSNGISRFDPGSGSCDTLGYVVPGLGKRSRPISRDLIFHHGKLVVATTTGIFLLDRERKRFDVMLKSASYEQHFLSLFSDRESNLWIGTNQGVLVIDPGDQHIRFFSLDQFGTGARLYPGRLAYDPSSDAILLAHSSDSLSNRIYSIPLNPRARGEASFMAMPHTIQGLAMDPGGTLWVAGGGRFSQLDRDTRKLREVDMIWPGGASLPWTYFMEASANGWVCGVGIDEFVWFHTVRKEVKRIHLRDLPGFLPDAVFRQHFEGFVMGERNVAYVFGREIAEVDLATGNSRQLRYDKSINPAGLPLRAMALGSKGEFWISADGGMGQFARQGDSLALTRRYSIKDGLISPIVESLHIDGAGRVWAFSASGLNAIDPVSGEVRSFGTREGLPFPYLDPMQVLSLPDSRMATVCGNGLIVFHPDSLWTSAAPVNVPVIIRRIRRSGQEIGLAPLSHASGMLVLGPARSVVDIEFQGLDYPSDFRLEYSYRISGLQDEWIFLGPNRLVTLPDLQPGNYVFEVKAGWPESTAPVTGLPITVKARFLQRKGVQGLLFAILVLGGYWMFRLRIAGIRRKEAERAEVSKQMAELELSALRSQMNPHFMFNSLNSIKNYILHAEPRVAAEYLSNFAHLIRMILHHSREKTISLADEIETLKLYVELEQLRFEEAFAFVCEVEEGLPAEHVQIPPMLLQPYVENAIWHGLMHRRTPGQLTLRFFRERDMVVCLIDDNGIGRVRAGELKSMSATRYKSMGMGITRARIEILNRLGALGITLDIIDKKDAAGAALGTRVEIRVPIRSSPD